MDSYKLLTEVALKMAIIQNTRSYVSATVLQPILNVLCKMKGLLGFVDVDPSIYIADHEVQLNSIRHRITFACKNLKRAVIIIEHIKSIIRSDFHNPNVPTFARLQDDSVPQV